MLNCDLGQRWPIENCPTRVNPAMKKTYIIERPNNARVSANYARSSISAYKLADIIGCSRKTIYRVSMDLYKKTPALLTEAEIAEVARISETKKRPK